MYIQKLEEMFREVVLKRNPSAIPHYYHKEMILYTNGQIIDYEAFKASHDEILTSSLRHEFEYDEETFLETGQKVAGRVWITIKAPNREPVKIEVILIVEYKEDKIFRLWELTYPDWSQLPDFQ